MAEIQDQVISDEEILKIAQHFLMSSPPGQLHDVLQDLQKVLPSGIITGVFLDDVYRAYNTLHGRIFRTPLGQDKVLITKQGEVDPLHYVDPLKQKIVDVDHAKGVVLSSSSDLANVSDSSIEGERAELGRSVAGYVASQYSGGNVLSGVYAKNGLLHVAIYGEKLNLRNYWSGSWLSTWIVSFSEENAISMTGQVKIRAHYFEEGNVQMQTTKVAAPYVITDRSPSGLASECVHAIAAFEQTLQQGLENMYNNMGDETFKAMRRKLPPSRNKMEWNINAHRLARTLGPGPK